MASTSTDVGTAPPPLPDGFVAIMKRDCPTCELVDPVLAEIRAAGLTITGITQDDTSFPTSIDGVVDDTDLAISWHHEIETVPTLIDVRDGVEQRRIVGWSRDQWTSFTGVESLGADLPEQRPGCGSLSVDPNLIDELTVRFSGSVLNSRRIELAQLEDEMEAAFDRGWTDGLPVVPPTEARVMRMLEGTTRSADEIVATVPPDLIDVTVEQVATNAVLAGCRPEYLPVVLAAVEAACSDTFNMHGLLATTMHSGPIIVVNGPITAKIGMNGGHNTFGQGNRANMTIGRALQLVIRNIGGGRPGGERPGARGVDMSMHGSPGKLSFCFAELEDGSPFTPLSVAQGFEPGIDTVTLFAGQGPTPIIDQISRTPESLVRSFAASLRAAGSTKLAVGFDSMLIVSPEHGRIFGEAGWDRDKFMEALNELLMINGDELIRGANGIDEGLPAAFAGQPIPKFRPGGLLVAHAGGDAGLFSSILTGWVGGPKGSDPVTREITP